MRTAPRRLAADEKGRVETVRQGRHILFGVAALLGAATVVLPAVAGSETVPSIDAVNSGLYYHYWSPSQATVNVGGVVTLSNPSDVPHGVEWRSGPVTPSCSGVPVGTTEAASGGKWSGSCTFSQPGTYVFYCTVHHAEMTGTVTVNANGTTTTTTQPPSGEGSTTTSSPPIQSGSPAPGATDAPGSPLAGVAAAAVKLTATVHGGSVRGSVDVSAAGAGGRLEVDLLATRASLASAAPPARVRVGRFARSSLPAGVVSFQVSLDARARRALRTRRRLALSARVLLTPVAGPPVTIVRSIRLHG